MNRWVENSQTDEMACQEPNEIQNSWGSLAKLTLLIGFFFSFIKQSRRWEQEDGADWKTVTWWQPGVGPRAGSPLPSCVVVSLLG